MSPSLILGIFIIFIFVVRQRYELFTKNAVSRLSVLEERVRTIEEVVFDVETIDLHPQDK